MIKINILTIIVLAFLILMSVLGMKKGFIKTVFGMCSTIVAIILTMILNPYVGRMLKANNRLNTYINKQVAEALPLEEAVNAAGESAQENAINKLPLPENIKSVLIKNDNKDTYKTLGVSNFKDYLVKYVTNVVINAIAFVLTFLIVGILIFVICFLLDIISKLPVLNQVNKTLGLLCGFVHGFIIVWIFFALTTALSATKAGSSLMGMISESTILNFIYSHNVISLVLNAVR